MATSMISVSSSTTEKILDPLCGQKRLASSISSYPSSEPLRKRPALSSSIIVISDSIDGDDLDESGPINLDYHQQSKTGDHDSDSDSDIEDSYSGYKYAWEMAQGRGYNGERITPCGPLVERAAKIAAAAKSVVPSSSSSTTDSSAVVPGSPTLSSSPHFAPSSDEVPHHPIAEAPSSFDQKEEDGDGDESYSPSYEPASPCVLEDDEYIEGRFSEYRVPPSSWDDDDVGRYANESKHEVIVDANTHRLLISDLIERLNNKPDDMALGEVMDCTMALLVNTGNSLHRIVNAAESYGDFDRNKCLDMSESTKSESKLFLSYIQHLYCIMSAFNRICSVISNDEFMCERTAYADVQSFKLKSLRFPLASEFDRHLELRVAVISMYCPGLFYQRQTYMEILNLTMACQLLYNKVSQLVQEYKNDPNQEHSRDPDTLAFLEEALDWFCARAGKLYRSFEVATSMRLLNTKIGDSTLAENCLGLVDSTFDILRSTASIGGMKLRPYMERRNASISNNDPEEETDEDKFLLSIADLINHKTHSLIQNDKADHIPGGIVYIGCGDGSSLFKLCALTGCGGMGVRTPNAVPMKSGKSATEEFEYFCDYATENFCNIFSPNVEAVEQSAHYIRRNAILDEIVQEGDMSNSSLDNLGSKKHFNQRHNTSNGKNKNNNNNNKPMTGDLTLPQMIACTDLRVVCGFDDSILGRKITKRRTDYFVHHDTQVSFASEWRKVLTDDKAIAIVIDNSAMTTQQQISLFVNLKTILESKTKLVPGSANHDLSICLRRKITDSGVTRVLNELASLSEVDMFRSRYLK